MSANVQTKIKILKRLKCGDSTTDRWHSMSFLLCHGTTGIVLTVVLVFLSVRIRKLWRDDTCCEPCFWQKTAEAHEWSNLFQGCSNPVPPLLDSTSFLLLLLWISIELFPKSFGRISWTADFAFGFNLFSYRENFGDVIWFKAVSPSLLTYGQK